MSTVQKSFRTLLNVIAAGGDVLFSNSGYQISFRSFLVQKFCNELYRVTIFPLQNTTFNYHNDGGHSNPFIRDDELSHLCKAHFLFQCVYFSGLTDCSAQRERVVTEASTNFTFVNRRPKL